MTRFRLPLLAAALALGFAAPAAAEEFTLFIYEPPAELAARTGPGAEAYWSKYNAFAGAMAQAGILRGGAALSEADPGDARAPRLGGYFVIDVADRAAAEAWAAQVPAPKPGRVEVRAHRPNPAMTAPPK